MAPGQEDYAALFRRALRNRDMSIRDLERRLKDGGGRTYSYEHIRKVIAGQPVMSEHFNDVVSRELELDAAEMWRHALRAKAISGGRSAMIASSLAASSPAPELDELWAELTADDHAKVTRYIQGLVEQRRAEVGSPGTELEFAL